MYNSIKLTMTMLLRNMFCYFVACEILKFSRLTLI